MSDDYKIGFGRPPKHTRFEKGRSGNPKGRPKGKKNLKTELEEELGERIIVREGGKAKKVSKQRAILEGQAAKAAQGDTEAAIRHYQTFLDLWSDPDPELRDQVTSAQRALARLTGTESS